MVKKYKQGIFSPKNIEKYEGDPSNIIYRSSWELKFFKWCDSNPAIIKWSSEEIIIPYICPTDNRAHRYFPDAKIKIKDKSGNIKTYLVEIKPMAQTIPPKLTNSKKRYITEVMEWGKNDAKWAAARQWCGIMGYEFVILNEYDLGVK